MQSLIYELSLYREQQVHSLRLNALSAVVQLLAALPLLVPAALLDGLDTHNIISESLIIATSTRH